MTDKSEEKDNKNPTPITADKFRDNLRKDGLTLKMWAEKNGYNAEYCSRVLNGMVKGTRGKGHEIAKKMGIK